MDDKVLEKYESLFELNGLILFFYEGDDVFIVFVWEFRVLMRIVIRILCMRDRIDEKIFNFLLKFILE